MNLRTHPAFWIDSIQIKNLDTRGSDVSVDLQNPYDHGLQFLPLTHFPILTKEIRRVAVI